MFGAVAKQGAYTGPVLWLHGEKEELVPAAKIAAYFDYWQKSGAPFPVQRIDYAGAYHSWTDPMFTPVRWFGNFASAKACPFMLLDAHGAASLLIDGAAKPVDPGIFPSCVLKDRGYSQGYDEAIRAKSLADTLAFFKQTLD